MINGSILRRQCCSALARCCRDVSLPVLSELPGVSAAGPPLLCPAGDTPSWPVTCGGGRWWPGWPSISSQEPAGSAAGFRTDTRCRRCSSHGFILPAGPAERAQDCGPARSPGHGAGVLEEHGEERGQHQRQCQGCRRALGSDSTVVPIAGSARPLQLLEGDGALVGSCVLQALLHLPWGQGGL